MFIGHLGVLSSVFSTFPHFSVGLAVFCLLISKNALCNLNIGSLSDVSIYVLQISSLYFFFFFRSTYNLCLLPGHKDIVIFF